MPVLSRFRLAPLLVALLLAPCLPALALAAPERVPAEAFFARSAVASAALSPNGKYLGVLMATAGAHDALVVIDLTTNRHSIAARYDNLNILHFAWVSDERLMYEVDSPGPGTVLAAVNLDHSGFVRLSDRENALHAGPRGRPLLDWSTFLVDPCNARNRNVVYLTNREPGWSDTQHTINLMRVDTLTGQGSSLPRPRHTIAWMLDQAGEAALTVTDEVDHADLLYRQDADHDWRVLASNRQSDESSDAIVPLQFGPDGKLYVTTRAGRDKQALYRFDLEAGRLAPSPMVETTGYDFKGQLVTTCSKVLGVEFTTDAESIEWTDARMKALQQTVDRLLPRTANLISVPARAETPWMLVRAYSDVEPMSWWLFNADTGQVSRVASSHAALDAHQLGRQQMVRYKARDGLEIPALLTLPPGPQRKHLPMVLLVHGGPYLRGPSWGWSSDSQFLASRGYAVLEPAFRGSLGYGYAHYRAGWKQWGLAMQDDLADGTRWAIAQGIADPQRVCIAGGSYGGYATLMGLVNDPDLYRCGIDWAGVTDIELLFKGSWNFPSDLSNRYKEHGFKELIGDPDKDAAQLAATSPIRQAARITRPLLLAYGDLDVRVPITHGTRLRDAVLRTNPDVEWVEYPDQGHGWSSVSASADFWKRVEGFLARCIGSDAQRAAAPAPAPR